MEEDSGLPALTAEDYELLRLHTSLLLKERGGQNVNTSPMEALQYPERRSSRKILIPPFFLII